MAANFNSPAHLQTMQIDETCYRKTTFNMKSLSITLSSIAFINYFYVIISSSLYLKLIAIIDKETAAEFSREN